MVRREGRGGCHRGRLEGRGGLREVILGRIGVMGGVRGKWLVWMKGLILFLSVFFFFFN